MKRGCKSGASLKINITKERELELLNKLRTNSETGCIEWQGRLHKWGYGMVKYQGENIGTHRFFYALLVHDLQSGEEVLHTCHNRKCCNPHHLYIGTQKQNIKDCIDAGRGNRSTGKGSRRHLSKLSENEIIEIHRLWHDGYTYEEIGKQFGFHAVAISRFVRLHIKQHLGLIFDQAIRNKKRSY